MAVFDIFNSLLSCESVETITRNFGQTFGGIAYIDLYTLAIVLLGFLIFIFGLILGISTLTVVGFAAMLVVGIIIMAIGLILNFTYSNIFKLVQLFLKITVSHDSSKS